MALNPYMITLAREAREWTQSDLAKAIDVTKSTVCRFELGELRADNDIESVATATRFDRGFFEQNDSIFGLGGDFLYRKRSHVSAKTRRRVQAECNIRKMQLERLLRGAEMPEGLPLPSLQPEEVGLPVERIAREVREALRIPPGPIGNLTDYLESAGIVLFTVKFGTTLIDGTNIRVPGLPPMMFLNDSSPGERHRFNLAHELGHLVMHFGASRGDAEDEANAFAREFLLPKAVIRQDLKNLDLKSAARLKPVWGVSMQALITQAAKIKAISVDRQRQLMIQLGSADMRIVEPFPLDLERPSIFARLEDFHRVTLGLSDDAMRKLLFTDTLGRIDVQRSPRLTLWGS